MTLPTNNDPGALAGALLGFVLLGHGQATDITSVLAGFSTLNMVKTEGSSVAAGSVVIVVAPGSHSASDSVSGMLLSFASQLAATGGPTVVAGDGAANRAGGLIARVRSDSTAKGAVSTVDNADTALGQLTTVLAAQEALGHHNGHFGTGAGVDGLLPGVSN